MQAAHSPRESPRTPPPSPATHLHVSRVSARPWPIVLTGWLLLSLTGCLGTEPLPSPTPSLPLASFTPTIAFPTLIPTATFTPSPSHTPAPDIHSKVGQIVQSEEFTSGENWELGEDQTGGSSIVDGRLSVAVRRAYSTRAVLSSAPAISDFLLEVSVRADVCAPGDEFGPVFRAGEANRYYRFTVGCDGSARLALQHGFQYITLAHVETTDAVIPGTAAENLLQVVARGDTFRCLVNGIEIILQRDPRLTEGSVGLFVEAGDAGQTTISFDYLRLWQLLPGVDP